MKILLPLLLAATALAADRTFERTLPAVPNIAVNATSGNIHLHPGSDTQVHILARLKPSNSTGWFTSGSGDTDARITRIIANPPIQQAGNTITIGSRNNDALYKNISIDYDITLPRASALTANTGSGDVTLEDVGTSLKASTGSGNITAHNPRGPISLDTGSGDIALDQASSDSVTAKTGSGSIRLKGASAALRASTGSGNIDIDGSPNTDWNLDTGSGNVTLRLPAGAHFTLDADTGSGTVHLDQPITLQGALNRHHTRGTVNGGGPTLKAQTGSGDITIR